MEIIFLSLKGELEILKVVISVIVEVLNSEEIDIASPSACNLGNSEEKIDPCFIAGIVGKNSQLIIVGRWEESATKIEKSDHPWVHLILFSQIIGIVVNHSKPDTFYHDISLKSSDTDDNAVKEGVLDLCIEEEGGLIRFVAIDD